MEPNSSAMYMSPMSISMSIMSTMGGLVLPRQPKGEPRIRNLCENSTVARPPNPTFYPPTKTPTCLPIAADKLARSALIVLFPFVTESKALGGGWTP